jgi:hypothetical protein
MRLKIKTGMAGSNSGKSRYEPTEILKKMSKKRRRAEGKKACKSN